MVGTHCRRTRRVAENTANGSYALSSNMTGFANAAVGAYSLQNNASGSRNAAFGDSTLWSNTTGTYNVAMGTGALEITQLEGATSRLWR